MRDESRLVRFRSLVAEIEQSAWEALADELTREIDSQIIHSIPSGSNASTLNREALEPEEET